VNLAAVGRNAEDCDETSFLIDNVGAAADQSDLVLTIEESNLCCESPWMRDIIPIHSGHILASRQPDSKIQGVDEPLAPLIPDHAHSRITMLREYVARAVGRPIVYHDELE
jgi:hypothetical protein